MTAKQIEEAAIKLPKRDRKRIAQRLLETLESKRDREILDAWVVEAERRDRELDEGTAPELPFDKVMTKLKASLRR